MQERTLSDVFLDVLKANPNALYSPIYRVPGTDTPAAPVAPVVFGSAGKSL